MTEPSAGPALSAAETKAAETLLTEAWGERTEVRAAEPIWDRSHVVRLQVGAGHLGAGRSAVLKRRGGPEHDPQDLGFGIELAALEYLNAMPVPMAPRLLAHRARRRSRYPTGGTRTCERGHNVPIGWAGGGGRAVQARWT